MGPLSRHERILQITKVNECGSQDTFYIPLLTSHRSMAPWRRQCNQQPMPYFCHNWDSSIALYFKCL